MTGRRRKMRIKRSSSTMHFTRGSQNGYSVTDEQVQAYIEDMKLQLESVDNSEDIQDVIDQFDSEDDYWAYEFTVYQKQRRSRIMCQR